MTNVRVHKGTTRVGDIEVTTSVLVPTPELDRLLAIAPDSQKIGAFLDWLGEQDIILCEQNANGRFEPACRSIPSLLAAYFDIDENKCEVERRQLLEAIRR